ncbi:molybdate ABC transporter substrate-binding protein [Brachyspira hyodysenteriae]|uniref:molybdate ABC transporter substrate-binding protein n=1 Tax=Brachyspira hyodysenteriae TaxID=159 RepID=UPI00063DC854|nr:molybdate ABC transporter substrate-binding protein [Brachyspira hyodysenteriae]KLI31615.1 molybdate ABC transporter substrate-binding protein [Brachyspira hyodysenteriae]MDA0061936.1 molybdate ABC transporter substrate-binding protein [Brachyspira hyodysenteriae]MDA0065697.1 molybdate ABC transporter substrate-binding protein [Brachyspira hyodysenteriae]MDA0070789.1 molybdate ABC transporter substrate-binding protein [Brachyspira hyodysenteriae]MDA0088666.1 molybdate ABC transporter substr
MKKIIFITLLISYLFISCGSSKTAENKEILVLAAASLTDVLTELANNYKTETGTTVTFSFASSGALQTQIEAGSPADIFFSAAQKQMDALQEKDLIYTDTRKDLLENKVVLISPTNSALNIKSFTDITNANVTKVGLGEPKSVPVGQYSEEILSNLSILDAVKQKAVYGSDVRNVLSWVRTGEVDCGIVYATDAQIANDINIIAEAPEGTHKKVIYPIAIVKGSENKEEAQKFINYISTDKAAEAFKDYGFTVIK